VLLKQLQITGIKKKVISSLKIKKIATTFPETTSKNNIPAWGAAWLALWPMTHGGGLPDQPQAKLCGSVAPNSHMLSLQWVEKIGKAEVHVVHVTCRYHSVTTSSTSKGMFFGDKGWFASVGPPWGMWNTSGHHSRVKQTFVSKKTPTSLISMDWYMGKFTGKPLIFTGKIDGFRLRFSLKPIHWLSPRTKSKQY